MSNIIIPESHKATYTGGYAQAARSQGAEARLVESPNITANEMIMARSVAEKLNAHYPGHLWAVAIEDARLIIKNLYLSGEWGFVITIPSIYSISSLEKQAVNAGGELLERYRQRRGGMKVEDIATLPTDFAGRHKPEL
jgi:hypothetical protein